MKKLQKILLCILLLLIRWLSLHADIPEDVILKEKEIFKAQSEDSGKPAEIVEKMIEGKVINTSQKLV